MIYLLRLYDSLLKNTYYWSIWTGYDRAPSILRACLFISAIQMVNISTIVNIIQEITGRYVPITRAYGLITLFIVVAANLGYAELRSARILEPLRLPIRKSKFLGPTMIYAILSFALLVVSYVVLYYSGQ